jgi:hypothetical protein
MIPPCPLAWTMDRERDWVPVAHVTVHADHEEYGVTLQSMGHSKVLQVATELRVGQETPL